MRKVKGLAIIVCAAGSLAAFVLPATPQTVQSVAATTSRSICIVLADGGNGTTSATGFVVADGFVLTAHHVVEGGAHLRVLCPDHPAIEVQMANADADNDVALLHNALLAIHPLPLGDSARVQVGQEIVVIGFPRADLAGAETATVTRGIVSAVRPGALQIQAPVGPGNSGSPVLTLQGQVIGVVRAGLGSQVGSNLATSFATGIDAAKPFLTSALGGLYGGVAVGNAPPARPAAPKPAPSFVITPGQGIGDLKLGMHRDEIEHVLGPPVHISRTADGGLLIDWQPVNVSSPRALVRGFFVVLSPAGDTVLVGVDNDPRYFIQGLHAGSTEVDVRAVLGEPSRVELATNETVVTAFRMLFYDSVGLRIVIRETPGSPLKGLVAGIDVLRSGCVFRGSPPVLQGGSCQ